MAILNLEEVRAAAKPTKLDLAIGSVFPRWGQKRIQARREFAWEGAVTTRLRASGSRLQGPEDYTVFPDRLQLIRNVRDLEQNFGMMQSIIDKLALYAFGRVNYRARTGDSDTNDIYEEYLASRFREIDLSGKNNLQQLICVAFKSMLRDGDFLLKWQKADDGKLYLSGIEGDRLGGIYMQSGSEDYFQGVTVDRATGRPISYKCFYRTKANAYVDPTEVPARDAIHLFDPRRYDQCRGITPFAPVVNEMRDIKEVMEDCRIGTKFENRHAAIGYTPNGQPIQSPAEIIENGADTLYSGAPAPQTELKPGMVLWAPSTAKYDFIKSDRPSGNFQTYLESLIRIMGMALNLPYGFLYNLSSLSGPSARMDAQQAHRVLESHKVNVRDRVLERVKNTLLIEGFGKKEIPYVPTWQKGVWQFPPAISIDAGRDSQAAIKEVQAGLLPKETWYAEIGEDADDAGAIIASEQTALIRRAQAMANETGVEFELALQLLEIRTPNGYVAPVQDKGDTPAQDAAQADAPSNPDAVVEMQRTFDQRLSELRADRQPVSVEVNMPSKDQVQQPVRMLNVTPVTQRSRFLVKRKPDGRIEKLTTLTFNE